MIRILLLFLLFAAGRADGDVQKCMDRQGRISYRDTQCNRSEQVLEIDRDFANELPLAPSEAQQKMLSNMAREREKRMRKRVKQRNDAMREYARKLEEKKARCERYKQEYDALHRFKRRNGNRVEAYESRLVHKMREACSS